MLSRVCSLVFALLLPGVVGNALGSESGFRPDPRPLATTMVYQCEAFEFTVRLGPGEMAVWLPDRYVVLSQVRSDAGVMYEEGDIRFWSNGDEHTLKLGDRYYGSCQLLPGRVPWEDARRRGVDFRAVGNEPGWYLEIQRGRQLLFVGDYGALRVSAPDPLGESSGPAGPGRIRIYRAVTGDSEVRVEITDESCADTMSGQNLPSRVAVTVNGRTLYGCGSDLHYPLHQAAPVRPEAP